MRFFPVGDSPDAAKVRAAWDDFVKCGEIDPTRVRPHVLRAWKRARRCGCDPHLARADVLSPADTMALLKYQSVLIEVAAPFMGALSRAAGQERHAAMLSDGNGRVLKIVADAQTVADPNFPRAGSLLSENVAGANGIGTAIAEGEYVELVGPEHYIQGFHVFTCQGVPLAGGSGRTAGVLSMSLRRVEAASKIRDILFCASEAAECELLATNLASYIVKAASCKKSLEALRQDIVQGIAQARLQIELAAYDIADSEAAALPLETAHELSLKFKRQAAIWRNLADQGAGSPEPIVLTELATDFVALMETEVRVAKVNVNHGRMDTIAVLDDLRALSQRLLGIFLSAVQSSQTDGDIQLDVYSEGSVGVLMLTGKSATGAPFTYQTRAPLLSAGLTTRADQSRQTQTRGRNSEFAKE